MKLGLSVGYWGLGVTPEQQLEMVTAAEEAGYDSVWSAEAYGSDAATVLGWMEGKTSRIRLGSGVFQMPDRSTEIEVMNAEEIGIIVIGRIVNVIGSSGTMVEA